MQPTAEFILHSLLVLHFIGLASLLGGFLTQMKAMGKNLATIVPAMVHGAWTMLITGVLMVGVREWMAVMGWDDPLNHMKIGVKSLVITLILVLVLGNELRNGVVCIQLHILGSQTFHILYLDI